MTDTDEWIEHDGSAWPEGLRVTDRVLVQFKSGYKTQRPIMAEDWYWLHAEDHPSAHIIAYKVIK